MSTYWDARTYDASSQPQQAWTADLFRRLPGLAPDSTILDVGCGTGRVTEQLLDLVPGGRVLAFDASAEMVELARVRLGDRAEVWCQDVLSVQLLERVDVPTARFPARAAAGACWSVANVGSRIGRQGAAAPCVADDGIRPVIHARCTQRRRCVGRESRRWPRCACHRRSSRA
jgi:hypothetical protein